jgi:thymidine phosphorylase
MHLAAEMLIVGGMSSDRAEAGRRAEEAVTSGRAAEVFARMTAALGGPSDLVERPHVHLVKAPVVKAVLPERRAVISEIDTRAVGVAIIELGGGRAVASDRIDLSVGFSDFAVLGTEVGPDRPIALVHAASDADADRAADRLRKAYRLADEASPSLSPLIQRLTAA